MLIWQIGIDKDSGVCQKKLLIYKSKSFSIISLNIPWYGQISNHCLKNPDHIVS